MTSRTVSLRGRALASGAWSLLVLCAGCAAPAANPAGARPAEAGLTELLERPAERALFDALRAYDDGQYALVEPAAQRALSAGLASPRDRATAYKLLAFVTCSSQRITECEAAFRAARGADARFALSRSEAGHPLWGPVYHRVLPPAP